MEHVLAISIGPVQEFIAAGRKTRDLWYGSELLCELARAAATALQNAGAELVFPHPSALHERQGVANKLLALLPAGENPAELAAQARSAAQGLLRERANRVKAKLPQSDVDHALLDAQVEDFLEFYSAWVAMDSDYQAARDAVDRLFAGRKLLRDFQPAAARDGRPKSVLDPSRESVIVADPRNAQAAARLKLRRGEHLDGLSLIRRWDDARRFVSTARVAADPFVRRLNAANAAVADDLRDAARELEGSEFVERFARTGDGLEHYAAFPYDTGLFFTDEERGLDSDDVKRTAQFRDLVRRAGRLAGVGEPWPYYAVLQADGDRMGKLIGSLNTKEKHQGLSRVLAEFAAAAAKIVAAHHGALVYGGGDDVLALLPVVDALPCADALRQRFVEAVRTVVADEPVSMSVGVAIAHYHEELWEVLSYARDAERAAKGPRDALAVAFHARSGGGAATRIVIPWQRDPVNQLLALAERYRREEIAEGVAYELRELVREFARSNLEPGTADALLDAEVARVWTRKQPRRPAHGDPPSHEKLMAFARDCSINNSAAVDAFVNALLIARRLAEAAGPLEVAHGRSH